MSRPQYSRYATESSSVGHGPVVNGGLIDFQDNLHRGVCEYLSPNQIVLQQQQGYPQQQPAVAGYPHQQQPAVAGYPQQQQPAVAGYPQQQQPCYAQQQAGYGLPPNVAQPAVLATQAAACFNGPPSFIHAHGVTYRPVEAMLPEPQESRQAPVECDNSHMEEDLEHKVHQRVAKISKEYIKSKSIISPVVKKAEPRAVHNGKEHPRSTRSRHHHMHQQERAHSVGRGDPPVEAPVFRRATRASDVESAAAQSVKRANANMPMATRFPLRY
jgi:hypothetical protein